MNNLIIPIDKLVEHEGHMILFTSYGKDGIIYNYSLECEDCQSVIADIDIEEDDQ